MSAIEAPSIDRAGVKGVVLRQSWRDLCFLHYSAPPSALRHIIPDGVQLDTFPNWRGEPSAWIGLVAFRLFGTRPAGLPPIPHFGAFVELNVRTYVRGPDGEPAVLFLSLDGPHRLVNFLARMTFGVPYFKSNVRLSRNEATIEFSSQRRGLMAATTTLEFAIVSAAERADPGSLEHFLTERYRYFAVNRGRLWTGDVRHEPYRLQQVQVRRFSSNHAASLGLPEGEFEHVCFCEGVDSEFLKPRVVRRLLLRPDEPC